MVYSIIDKKSFQSLSKWLKLVKEINGEDGYVLGVAANKSDLYKKSVVSDWQGQDYAKKIKAIWKSTSAKEEDRGIEELIDELLENYLKIQNNSTNQEYIKLSSNKENNKEEGCCKGNNKNKQRIDDSEEKMGRENRINSKISTISVDESNNKDDDEDF